MNNIFDHYNPNWPWPPLPKFMETSYQNIDKDKLIDLNRSADIALFAFDYLSKIKDDKILNDFVWHILEISYVRINDLISNECEGDNNNINDVINNDIKSLKFKYGLFIINFIFRDDNCIIEFLIPGTDKDSPLSKISITTTDYGRLIKVISDFLLTNQYEDAAFTPKAQTYRLKRDLILNKIRKRLKLPAGDYGRAVPTLGGGISNDSNSDI